MPQNSERSVMQFRIMALREGSDTRFVGTDPHIV